MKLDFSTMQPMQADEMELGFDWNGGGATRIPFELNDDTLRDGLQSPSVSDPPLETKIRMLRLQAELGITTAGIGLPGAGPRAFAHSAALARTVAQEHLSIEVNCAARTHRADLEPVAEIASRTGVAPLAYMFIGASPIRRFAEGWDLDFILATTERALRFALDQGLEVALTLEDTVRTSPEDLERIFGLGLDMGVRRLVICDTVGASNPRGVRRIVEWTRALTLRTGSEVALDWHGHSDRGLALANSLAAWDAGVTRIHGTCLGVGERCGNAAIDQLLVNLALEGHDRRCLDVLPEYCALVSKALGFEIPNNYPVFGADAFRTGTGVHAAAIVKAHERGLSHVADRVYSSVPARWFGRSQEIEVGPMSGMHNVRHWMRSQGLQWDPRSGEALLNAAKAACRNLSDAELWAALRAQRAA